MIRNGGNKLGGDFGSAPAHAVEGKARLFSLAAIVDVAQVDEDLALERGGDALEVEGAEFVPLGDDHQRIGSVGGGISIVGEVYAGHQLFGLVPRHGRAYREIFQLVKEQLQHE